MQWKENKIIIMAVILTVFGFLAWLDKPGSIGPGEVNATELKSDLPKMVELFTPGCSSCRAMDPLVEDLRKRCEHHGIGVDKIDVSKSHNAHLVEDLDLMAVPTFVFLDKNGVETSRLVGRQTETTLHQSLSTLGGQCGEAS
jgi:thiol-disulfide isomerase/thioredoxin